MFKSAAKIGAFLKPTTLYYNFFFKMSVKPFFGFKAYSLLLIDVDVKMEALPYSFIGIINACKCHFVPYFDKSFYKNSFKV